MDSKKIMAIRLISIFVLGLTNLYGQALEKATDQTVVIQNNSCETEGFACNSNKPCCSELTCSGGVCQPACQNTGGSCSSSQPCCGSLECIPDGSGSICSCAPNTGCYCTENSQCTPGVCNNNVCGACAGTGGSCVSSTGTYEDNMCCSSECVGGYCSCGEGLGCTCNESSDCGTDLVCYESLCVSCLPANAPTTDASQCCSGDLLNGLCSCSTENCACTENSQCESGVCDPLTNNTCVTPQATGENCINTLGEEDDYLCLSSQCVNGMCSSGAVGGTCYLATDTTDGMYCCVPLDGDCNGNSGIYQSTPCATCLASGESCSVNGDQGCLNGECINGICSCGSANGCSCNENSQCESGVCDLGTGVCATTQVIGGICTNSQGQDENALCSSDDQCINGICSCAPNIGCTCATSGDCNPPYCVNGLCATCLPTSSTCTQNGDCCSDICGTTGVCLDCQVPGGSCSFGQPCCNDTICVNGLCSCGTANGCTCNENENSECDSGSCNGGVCQAPAADGETCQSDANCQNQNCESNYCCPTDCICGCSLGMCTPCADDTTCSQDSDCESGCCVAVDPGSQASCQPAGSIGDSCQSDGGCISSYECLFLDITSNPPTGICVPIEQAWVYANQLKIQLNSANTFPSNIVYYFYYLDPTDYIGELEVGYNNYNAVYASSGENSSGQSISSNQEISYFTAQLTDNLGSLIVVPITPSDLFYTINYTQNGTLTATASNG